MCLCAHVCVRMCVYVWVGVLNWLFFWHGKILGKRGGGVDLSSMLAKRVKCHHKRWKERTGGRKQER